MKWRVSVRSELILCCVGLVLLTLLCQIGFNTYFGKSLSIHTKESEIEDLYTLIVNNYTDDAQALYDLVGDAQRDKNLKVQILSRDGMIYNSDMMENETLRDFDWEQRLPLDHEKPPTVETNEDMVRLEETIEYNGEPRTIIIWSSVVAIDGTVGLFTKTNLGVSFAVMVLAILGVIFFSERFTRPLREIESVAENVANLQFTTTANEDVQPKEVASLAKSINIMSQSLESMIEKLSTDNANLTTKVEYQEKLEQMRRQFVANISHEMKTPLSMVMMYAESLQMDVPGIDKDYYCATIREEAAGLNAMVAQLLDISSVENGLSKLECKDMNFSQFATEVSDKTKVLLEGFQVSRDIAPDLWIHGDTKYLDQAIRNYVTNASAHTPAGGTIALSVQAEDGWMVFSLRNQGKPIAQEDLPHIWDSFYRADKARTQTAQKRVGLGLYLVKTCINAHQGDVGVINGEDWVEFYFRIPMIEP